MRYTACMKQRQITTNQPDDGTTRNSLKKRSGLLLQYVGGYVLALFGATAAVLGLTATEGLLATVMFVLGSTLALVGIMVTILAYAQAVFGAVVSATEEVVARMQENQPTTPPSPPTP